MASTVSTSDSALEPVTVFFSYSHRDERLRDKLAPHLSMLQRQGIIKSWHDRKISAGIEWARAIDEHLNAAEIILLLVSADFLNSDYCYDIEMQQAIARHESGEARVIPIILRPVDWSGAPFGKLQAFPKNAKPVTKWSNQDEAFANIAQGIRQVAQEMAVALRDRPSEPASNRWTITPQNLSVAQRTETSPTEESVVALSFGELEELGGQVPLDSPFYVYRPPIEERCYEAIAKPGALIRVKAPRQMGKSSLTIRIFDYVEKQGYRTVWLNLQRAGEQSLWSLDSFLRWICDRTSRSLRLPNQVEEYWQGISGSMDKCTDYFELYLLEEISAPLAICLDEVDEVFKYPTIASDFLGLLRSWHEESKINPVWRNFRLVLTHSEEVYVPLNINQSPFNVGVSITLPPFTHAQLADLAQRHGLHWSYAEVELLMDMVGGHPYLTRVALQQIMRGEVTLAQFLQVAPTQEWILGSHLRRHLGNLEERNLAIAMKQLVTAEGPLRLPIPEASKLVNLGLARFQGNDVVPLCNLYRQYFREVLK
ncbi:AAA-like domain-containing protein [Thermoleptolyngbya sp. C42_A2020_037]|uniref:AAA-like domain-containing protein n=1 Tax=Thermoleptolyngbya sp. C42_A2020_037 TaxID=2747799 RepID=UPI0019F73F54|nr:AAA-like domain-containing protein [Thermoleptolyngbya sp. C42_A2020_037]MBF2085460.1 AAA-like domain-containing protein [Thermoleptolyngbya sp. C42_A2020_037]